VRRHRHQLPRHHRALAHEARLAEQLQRLALLSRITQAIGERQDLRSIFSVVARALEDELPVDFCMPASSTRRATPHRDLRRHAQRAAAQSARHAARTTLPIDENGLEPLSARRTGVRA
jgi:hypothetical protein